MSRIFLKSYLVYTIEHEIIIINMRSSYFKNDIISG